MRHRRFLDAGLQEGALKKWTCIFGVGKDGNGLSFGLLQHLLPLSRNEGRVSTYDCA